MKLDHYRRPYLEYGKGRYAYSTDLRRLVWEDIVWPLITDRDNSSFSLKEYRIKRDEVCKNKNITPKHIAGGFMSLVNKGIILHQYNMYSIHYKLIPYMKKGVDIDYGVVLKEVVIRS
jgi:hypothetical protein